MFVFLQEPMLFKGRQLKLLSHQSREMAISNADRPSRGMTGSTNLQKAESSSLSDTFFSSNAEVGGEGGAVGVEKEEDTRGESGNVAKAAVKKEDALQWTVIK